MKYLQAIKNKCKCGAEAEAIKEETINKRKIVIDIKIVALSCKKCGLKYHDQNY
jgi:hypothetical protein